MRRALTALVVLSACAAPPPATPPPPTAPPPSSSPASAEPSPPAPPSASAATAAPKRPSRPPVRDPRLAKTSIRDVVQGKRHGCALDASGAVSCWGENGLGQVGGVGRLRAKAERVKDLPPVVEIGAGWANTCARTAAGKVYCWGNAANHLLGADVKTKCDGWISDEPAEPGPCSRTPVEMPVSDATHLAVGLEHMCVASRGGTVTCWGQNQFGQLGLGPGDESGRAPLAVPLAGSGEVVELAVTYHDTCARRESGDVTCWGRNWMGELCTGAQGIVSARAIEAFTGADELRGSGALMCARHGDDVACCGHHAKVGESGKPRWLRPEPALALAGAEELATSGSAVCGRRGTQWSCVADWSQATHPEYEDHAAKLAPIPEAEQARMVLVLEKYYVRDDGVLLHVLPSDRIVNIPLP